jgi:LacI family transcriptional regulator
VAPRVIAALGPRRVALVIETSNAYARGLLQGIADYVRDHESWSMYLPEQSRGELAPKWLARFSGEGAIVRIETPAIAQVVKQLRCPVVDVSAARLVPKLPWVETDDAAIADAALVHLQERGFRSFAFVGEPSFNWSKWREERFVQQVAATGASCAVLPLPSRPGRGWERDEKRLRAWIESLPRPVGVLAAFDSLAVRVLDACRALGIAVPEEVAVLGVDDDPVLCRLANPPLSSVSPDARGAGYRAAAALSAMMLGKPVQLAHRVPPQGVVVRQSSDVIAVKDTVVASALQFIRERGAQGVRIADLLARTRLSRRSFEARFVAALGRTPHQELLRCRLAKVKTLLRETDFTVSEIAERAGYKHAEYLTVQFTRETKESPSQYRRRHQIGREL